MNLVGQNCAIVCPVLTFSEVSAGAESGVQQTAWQKITGEVAVHTGVVHTVMSTTTKHMYTF